MKRLKTKINITIFSTSALCLTHHWNIPVSVSVRDRTRPICPRSKAKWGRKEIKSVSFPIPYTVPSVTLWIRLLYFYDLYCSIVDIQSSVSFRCTVNWISHTYTYHPPFLNLFSSICHYRVLIRVPCAISWVLFSYLFYIQ